MAKERFDTAGDMLHYCRHLLYRATQERNHPLRTPAVGTVGPQEDWPYLRTVILREVNLEDRTLLFYTDARSDKVSHLKRAPYLSWLFWDPGKQIQVRARTAAALHQGDEIAAKHWAGINLEGRKNYAGERAPGSSAEQATRALPDLWENAPSREATDYAFEHFMVVVTEIREMDCLLLHPEGHQRIIHHWNEEEGQWTGGWVVA